MNDQNHAEQESAEAVGAAVREGRPEGAASTYRIQVANENLDFRSITLTDPVPLGRQIIAPAGGDPVAGFSLFAILPSGDFEDIRLDEAVDLRERGIKRFVMFQTDREFKFTLEDDQLQWGKPVISGAVLHKLANATEDEAIFLEVRGGEDQLVERADLIDLTKPGIEKLFKAPKQPLTFEIIVNTRPKTVPGPEVTFEQIVELAYPGPHDPNVTFSMSYRNAASKPHAGELGAGGSVKVKKKGTIFNVCRTVQS
jgi:hypothetical protein